MSGNARSIVYLDCDDKKHDLVAFLDNLEIQRVKEHGQLVALLEKTAEYGLVWNNYRTKRLQGEHAKPICEFCSSKEARIFWFPDKFDENILVCTHGFVARGKHDHSGEIKRAIIRMKSYYGE